MIAIDEVTYFVTINTLKGLNGSLYVRCQNKKNNKSKSKTKNKTHTHPSKNKKQKFPDHNQ